MAHPSNLALIDKAKSLSYLPLKAYEGLYSKRPNTYLPVNPNVADSTIIYAYFDNARIATIGWGTTHYPNGRAVSINDSCTKAQADALLVWEAGEKAKKVLQYVDVPLNVYQLAALISATYNTGPGAPGSTRGFYASPLRKVINSGADANTVAKAMFTYIATVHNKPDKGLIKRRLGEARFSIGMEKDFYIEVNDPRFINHYRNIVAKKK